MIHGSSIDDAVSVFHPIAASKEMNGAVAAAGQSACELSTHKCTLGCPLLDRLLDGGVPCRSVTEISGESATGKTQLCLQLLLSAQLPAAAGGLGAAALFVHSEFPFPARRLRQLAAASPLPDPLDHVFVAPAHTPDDLLTLLDRLHAALLSPRRPAARPVRLLVVDSVAALFRSEFDNSPGELRRRSLLFFKIGARLKLCAQRFDLAVVVTNQVVDVIDGDVAGAGGMRVGNYDGLYSSGRRVCPALGLSWANCVNTRLFLSRRDVAVEAMDGSSALAAPARPRRRMQVVFAPHLQEAACEFEIRREGVFGIET